jgi:NTP pyrophosphatase (non-canonical NTP hydrolase)
MAAERWKGIFKLTEECGELGQVLGKLGPFPGGEHPSGEDLRRKLIEEIGDVKAALQYFIVLNLQQSEMEEINDRATAKFRQFIEWGLTGVKE